MESRDSTLAAEATGAALDGMTRKTLMCGKQLLLFPLPPRRGAGVGRAHGFKKAPEIRRLCFPIYGTFSFLLDSNIVTKFSGYMPKFLTLPGSAGR